MSNKYSSDDKMQKLFEGFRRSLNEERTSTEIVRKTHQMQNTIEAYTEDIYKNIDVRGYGPAQQLSDGFNLQRYHGTITDYMTDERTYGDFHTQIEPQLRKYIEAVEYLKKHYIENYSDDPLESAAIANLMRHVEDQLKAYETYKASQEKKYNDLDNQGYPPLGGSYKVRS